MTAPDGARRLLSTYLRPHRPAAVALVVLMLGAAALPLLGPQLLRRFVDQATAGRPLRLLIGTASAYLCVMLAGRFVNVLATYEASKLAWTATNQLREDLVEHILGLDLSFHGKHTPGELIERVDGDVTNLADFVARFLFQLVGSALLLVGTVALVFREDARIGAALVTFLATATFTIVRLQRRAVPFATADREAQAQLIGMLEERVGGAEDIRALGAADHTMHRFFEANAHVYRTDFAWQVVSGRVWVATNMLFALGTALMLGLGVVFLRRGVLTIGAVVLLFQYTIMVRRPLDHVIQQFKQLQHAAAGAARVVQLLGMHPTIVERPAAVALPPSGPLAVHFESVTFAYPTDPAGDAEDDAVLHDVSFELAAGRSLGLVGRTGSGKSTIARLLLRLYETDQGVVRIAGTDVRDVQLASLRSRVRLVTQDVQLFAADLRDNLTLFARDGGIEDDRMVEVLHDLGLGEWFASLPHGLDTVLRGDVSAGEAQLLAFARVFLVDPGLVILDEASSRLDPATEQLIDRAVDRLLENRTAILIAHRLSSLERVDEIAVVDHGRLVEHGSRVQLAADPASRFGHLLAVASTGSGR